MPKTKNVSEDKTAKATRSQDSKVSKKKPKQLEVNAKMVIKTLNEMSKDPQNGGKGHSLAAIRNYIRKNYGLKMTYYRQALLKDVMEQEYLKDKIEMTNYKSPIINFTKRFVSSEKMDENLATAEEDESTEEDEE